MKDNFEDGTLCYIHFGNTVSGEINNEHLAVLYNIKGVDNVIFAVPLTSPKLKHFKTEKDFETRNYLETKFIRLHYIRQTDSIALFDQVKTIGISRIRDYYKDADGKIVVLNQIEQSILKSKLIKYIKYILYK